MVPSSASKARCASVNSGWSLSRPVIRMSNMKAPPSASGVADAKSLLHYCRMLKNARFEIFANSTRD